MAAPGRERPDDRQSISRGGKRLPGTGPLAVPDPLAGNGEEQQAVCRALVRQFLDLSTSLFLEIHGIIARNFSPTSSI